MQSTLIIGPSRWRDFSDCPRRYLFAHVLKLAPSDPDAGSIGEAVHTELHARHEQPARHDDRTLLTDARPETHGDVQRFVDRHRSVCPRGDAEYLGGEVEWAWYIRRKDTFLRGRVDALWQYPDGSIEIRDYKTGACPDTLDGHFAAQCYGVLAAANLQAPRRRIFLTFESLSQEDSVVTRAVDDQFLSQAIDAVLDVATHLRTAVEYPPRPSDSKCGLCSYRSLCRDSLV